MQYKGFQSFSASIRGREESRRRNDCEIYVERYRYSWGEFALVHQLRFRYIGDETGGLC